MTPKDAMKETNELKAKQNMEQQASRTRKYPPIEIGDRVKIYRKERQEKRSARVFGSL